MSKFMLGLVVGSTLMFFYMYYVMVQHVKRWRCGSDNPRKRGES